MYHLESGLSFRWLEINCVISLGGVVRDSDGQRHGAYQQHACSHAAVQGGMLWIHAASLLLSKDECWLLSLCLGLLGMPKAGWMHGWEHQGVSQFWGRVNGCWEEQVGRGGDGRELLHGRGGSGHRVGTQQWVQR